MGSAAELATLVRPDTAYLLYAAERILDGARAYVDVVEINPPLSIALHLPAVLSARAVGVSDILSYRLQTILMLLASLGMSSWALRFAIGAEPVRLYRRIIVLLALALFLLPESDFGQREHLLVAAVIPYLLLAAGRVRGQAAPPSAGFAAGLLAGAGLALKPHFLLVWAAVEAYVTWRRRESRPAPEAVGVLVFLVLYTAAVLVLTPGYLPLVALVGPVYGRYLHESFLLVLATAPGTTICCLALLSFAVLRRRANHPEIWTIAAVATVASFVAGAAQQKGWTYHFYPSTVSAFLLLGLAVIDLRRPLPAMVQGIYAAVAFASFATSVCWAVAMGAILVSHGDPGRERGRAQLNEMISATRRLAPPGGSMYAFSFTINSGFPLVNYSGLRWASRFPHLWLLEALYEDQLEAQAPLRYRRPEEMGSAERYLNDAVYQDLARNRPDLLLVLWNARDLQRNGPRRLDYLGYFGRDPRISRLLRDYRFAEEVGPYRLYVPAGSVNAGGSPPISEPGRRDVVHADLGSAQALVADRKFLLKSAMFLLLAALAFRRERRLWQSGSVPPRREFRTR